MRADPGLAIETIPEPGAESEMGDGYSQGGQYRDDYDYGEDELLSPLTMASESLEMPAPATIPVPVPPMPQPVPAAGE